MFFPECLGKNMGMHYTQECIIHGNNIVISDSMPLAKYYTPAWNSLIEENIALVAFLSFTVEVILLSYGISWVFFVFVRSSEQTVQCNGLYFPYQTSLSFSFANNSLLFNRKLLPILCNSGEGISESVSSTISQLS